MTNDDFPERRGANCAARITILSLMKGNKNPPYNHLKLKECLCECVSPGVFVLCRLGNTVGDHPFPMGPLVRCLDLAGRSDGTL